MLLAVPVFVRAQRSHITGIGQCADWESMAYVGSPFREPVTFALIMPGSSSSPSLSIIKFPDFSATYGPGRRLYWQNYCQISECPLLLRRYRPYAQASG